MKPFDGDPIKPLVDKLMDELKPKAGDVFLHQDIAHIAGIEYPSHRYRTVIVAWKKRLMREQNIDILSVVGMGYRVLDDNERVSVGIKDFSHSVRQMGHSVNRIKRADTAKLDEMHRRQQDHATRLSEVIEAGRKASKHIGFAGRVVSLPRPKKDTAA